MYLNINIAELIRDYPNYFFNYLKIQRINKYINNLKILKKINVSLTSLNFLKTYLPTYLGIWKIFVTGEN